MGYERDFLVGLYERMVLIRGFEDRVKLLFLEGVMPGTIHQCQGQEATAVGVCSALAEDDFITSTHRPHGHALAKGLTPEELLIELFGGAGGCCRGKGGSMHVGNMAKGMLPAIAIVGGNIPVAAGMALAFKMQGTRRVVGCFFGDGATSEGAFHEGVNLMAVWRLPVVLACENNLYGASTHVSKVSRVPSVAERAAGYGIRGERVDGNDVLAVYEAARQAVEECRDGEGPVLLELMTYRITGHSRRDPCHYQPPEEREEALRREPIGRFERWLAKERPDITPEELAEVKAGVSRRLAAAVETGRNAPKPAPADVLTGVYA
ncbi:MAG: thiamine pyrophosphate-dependent dehydrogenase E1 component subunit alpha [Armatimonadetes bacterium]|nr:thiamine pyrophosphate-dependent dehydrogenase E1 component subunit alpha [Armatimonadota bacterium]